MTETDWAAVTAFAVVVALGRCQQRLYARWQPTSRSGVGDHHIDPAHCRSVTP